MRGDYYMKSTDDLLKELNGSEYFVENVDTIFISKEYINELNYNSKENFKNKRWNFS